MTRRDGGSSHPPTLLTRVRRALVGERLVTRGDVVVVACSGGPDSTALLHALAWLRKRVGHEVVAASVDHGLRAEAAAEIAIVGALASALGVVHHVARVDVARGGNLQARAREARLEALTDVAQSLGATRVATGHTADDRAETLLMRVVRGTGIDGLAVLPPSAPMPVAGAGSIVLVRPLHRCRRADVVAHLERHHLAHALDPSNADPRFLRTRVRAEVLPLLATLNPRVVDALTDLADAAVATRPPPGSRPPVEHLSSEQAATKAAQRRPSASRSAKRIVKSG